MRILILGATGRTGRLLVDEALRRGHEVNVLISHASKLSTNPKLVTVFEGTPLNPHILAQAMKSCDAVLSTLNISRVSDFPWAKLRTSVDFLSLSMKNILYVAKPLNVNRIIITTAWGAAETRKDIPFWFRWLIRFSNIGYAYKDHERQEKMLQKTDLNWTVVRPVGLTDEKKIKEVEVSLNNTPKPKLMISRFNTARFMMDVLEKNLYIREFPVVFEK